MARDALTEAMTDPDPELRTRAASILGSLSLVRPGDSPSVRKLLEQYRTRDAVSRVAFISEELQRQPNNPATITVMKRILAEAMSDDDRWAAARMLQVRMLREPDIRRQVREFDVPIDSRNVPLLVTVGLTWQGNDTPKAISLLRRATDLTAERGAPVSEEMLGIFRALTNYAFFSGQYDDVATLLRQQISFGHFSDSSETPAQFRLLALHAHVGPLKGFVGDLAQLDGSQLAQPIPLYCAARLLQRLRYPLLAEATAMAALLRRDPDGDVAGRVDVGQFLVEHGWDTWAEREFRSSLNRRGVTEVDCDALMRLSLLAIDRDDPTAAADYLDRAVGTLPGGSQVVRTNRQGNQQIVTDSMLRVEANLQRLRATQRVADKKAINDQLDDLLRSEIELDAATEIVPALRRQNRDKEANELFKRLYDQYKAILDADPTAENQNNLAWLCARSGERAKEAVRLSTKAITTDKDNAAYLDTAAEAQFRIGNATEAAKLERRALELRPGDPFMQKQLRRFERAIK